MLCHAICHVINHVPHDSHVYTMSYDSQFSIFIYSYHVSYDSQFSMFSIQLPCHCGPSGYYVFILRPHVIHTFKFSCHI